MEITKELVKACIFGTISCAAVGVQFNIRPKHLAAAAVGSFLSRFIYMMLTAGGVSYAKCTVAAAAAAALYSELMARKMRSPANMYLITSIIPLVPGSTLYYTMSALALDDIETAAELGLRTMITAGAVAMGIFIVSSFIKILSGSDLGRLTSELTRPDKKKTIKNIK